MGPGRTLWLIWPKKSSALAGDLGESEGQLARTGAVPPSRVLEVSRQTARSSSILGFINGLAPQIVIVTTDRPDTMKSLLPTIDRLRNGAQVFRTGPEGAISVEMKGASVAVHRVRQ
jgi:beta-lactamase superfamily II metal-dependent hydrolase